MATAAVCPDLARLQRFALGDVPQREADGLFGHLAQCSRCLDALQQSAPQDSLIHGLRDPVASTVETASPELDSLIERLRQMPGLPAGRNESAFDVADVADILSPAESPGELGRLGGYRIVKVLGSGGMGIVFLAEDPRLNRPVAIKAMKPNLARNPTAGPRFLREARAAALLKNDHVVTIHQVGEDRGIPFLVMELLQGQSLQARMQPGQPLPIDELLRIARETASALATAHQHGLIHRDVKPANIWLEAKDEGGRLKDEEKSSADFDSSFLLPPSSFQRVKILDFGLARAVQGDSELTQEGDIVGTPAYMAPEQARGEPVDARCDLFSLGCVLYRMSTGQPPFQRRDSVSTLVSVAIDRPVPPAQLNPQVPPPLSELVMGLLSKDPAGRPASAALVARRLASIEQRLQKGGWSRARPVWLHVAARCRWLTIGTGMLVVCLGLALFLLRQTADDSDDSRGTDASTRYEASTVQPAASTFDKLDPAMIPSRERFSWQPAELVAVLGEHRGRQWRWVRQIALSPDGKLLASIGGQSNISLWDAETRELRGLLQGHSREIGSIAFTPDGRKLLSGGNDRTIRLWDVAQQRELRRYDDQDKAHECMAVSPDGKLALSSGPGHVAWLWEVETGNDVRKFQGHAGQVVAIAFDREGKTALTGSADRSMILWDVSTGKPLRRFKGHTGRCSGVAFLPDGRRAVSCSHDSTICLWDLQHNEPSHRFTGHTKAVHAMSVSRDGRRLLSCGPDRTVRLWDVNNGDELRMLELGSAVSSVVFSKDERHALTGDNSHALRRWDLETGNEVASPGNYCDPDCQWRLAISPDGRQVLSSKAEHVARLWDMTTACQVQRFTMDGFVWGVAILPQANKAVCVGKSGLGIWDLAESKAGVIDTSAAFWSLSLSADGRRAAAGGYDGVIAVWNFEAPEKKWQLRGHRGGVYGVALSGDGRKAVSTAEDFVLRLWDTDTGTELRSLALNTRSKSVAFAADGRHIACGDDRGFVRLWDVTGPRPAPLPLPTFHTDLAFAVTFSPDSRRLASAGYDGRIIVWDIAQERLLHDWQLPGAVGAICFAADGRHLITNNGNGTLYVLRLSKPS